MFSSAKAWLSKWWSGSRDADEELIARIAKAEERVSALQQRALLNDQLLRDAERRAAVADERAANLEQYNQWLRVQVEASGQDKDRAIKIMANVFAELRYGMGFKPFPEAAGLPPEKEAVAFDPDIFESPSTAVEDAMHDFKMNELRRRERMFASAGKDGGVAVEDDGE
jgi:hypothetical protein